ncbi:site-specific integrase [Duganella sp. Root336D2]|uniref:site-specific integrase n=1 Tax=Duganella sp. Root336D2 TaxID=1736518 RepID=UPI0006F5E563|nr:site-specific integrase [Duganella sp. Root336D2]KQV51376.1 integrase [Duganella sp. Root336D2]
MASVIKIGNQWRAQVRRKGFPAETRTFTTKGQATAWAATTEANMMALKHQDVRIISKMTVADLIDKYTKEIGAVKPFGKNKKAVLGALRIQLGETLLPDLSVERLTQHLQARQRAGAGGVTIAVDLTYLGSVLKAAKNLWRLPVDPTVTAAARDNMKYLGLSPKSIERDRRPTAEELTSLKAHFNAIKRQKVPMADIIDFAVETAMRLGEIIRLQWDDLNEEHRTIIIRNRKHPTEKTGNDQEVPLLGSAFEIVKRQPRHRDEGRIFPVTDGTVSSIFPRACNKLGIQDLRFHDLRHEGVSRLFEQRYSIEEVALVSGHRDWKMLSRYLHLRARDLHRT